MKTSWTRKHKSKLKHTGDHVRPQIHEDQPQIFMSRQPSMVQQQQLITLEQQKKIMLEGSYHSDNMNDLNAKINGPKLTTSMILNRIRVLNIFYLKSDISIVDQTNSSKKILKDEEFLTNENGEVFLFDLIQQLKRKGLTYFDKSLISVYNQEETLDQNRFIQNSVIIPVYTFCGQDPLPENFRVKVDLSHIFEIKVRSTKSTLLDQMMEEQNISAKLDYPEDNKIYPRVKERRISEVIERVALWRRFYTGFYDENRKFVQMPLNEAADKVKIAKKTLDDYLLQVRCGKRYGFDFNKNRNDRIGKLRSYVKDMKKNKSDQQE